MITNTRLLFYSQDMHKFMEAHNINSIAQLFDIPLYNLVIMPGFPYRLLNEWVFLRDKFNFLGVN